jgi:hypothetical protein
MTAEQLIEIESDADMRLRQSAQVLEHLPTNESARTINALGRYCKLLLAEVRTAQKETKDAEEVQAVCMKFLTRLRDRSDVFIPSDLDADARKIINGNL